MNMIKNEMDLFFAVTRNKIEKVVELIQNGTNIHLINELGYTALISAASYNHPEIVKLLINAGADINVQNKYGHTALIKASRKGHYEVVKLLIQNEADVHIIDKNGWNALMWAINFDWLEIAKLLTNAMANCQYDVDQIELINTVINNNANSFKLTVNGWGDITAKLKVN